MNRRKAKRIAAGLTADLVTRYGEQLARAYGTPDDRERVRASLVEISAELRHRAGRTPDPVPDPNQVALFEPTVTISLNGE